MEGAAPTQQLLRKATEPNIVQAWIEVEQFYLRNAQRWARLDVNLLKRLSCFNFRLFKSSYYMYISNQIITILHTG